MNIQPQWNQCWNDLGVACPPPEVQVAVVRAYSSPDRRYHTLAHVLDCLGKLDRASAEAEDAPCIQAALWFHDIVYDTHAGDNERRSADLAYETALDAGVSQRRCQTIADLVMATDHRTEPNMPDARLICDIDLSIFGETEERFREYDRQIAQEYAWVPPKLYREKRADVIDSFLRRRRIYRTDRFYEEYEVPARRNLEQLVRELRG